MNNVVNKTNFCKFIISSANKVNGLQSCSHANVSGTIVVMRIVVEQYLFELSTMCHL